jgi:hypothetical protein
MILLHKLGRNTEAAVESAGPLRKKTNARSINMSWSLNFKNGTGGSGEMGM